MKNHIPGFVPVPYKKAGKVLLRIGILCLIIKFISYATNWFTTESLLFYFGIGLVAISLYLIFIVPPEE
ncbi:hypothetical protein EOL96_09515 [Candidatus Saccharibacteria bacterium]|nr:hypothetical protein [Candidatus Saccharibacteria bacterium]